jgi:hypothetical protein
MHINSSYERNGPLEIEKLFTVVDCTKEIIEKQKDICANIDRIRDIAGKDKEPIYPVDLYCFNKPICPYKSWCFRDLPEKNIFTFSFGNALRNNKKIELYRKGIDTLEKLVSSNEKMSNSLRSLVESEIKELTPQADRKAITDFIETSSIKWPVYHLDFETFKEAIPSFDRQHPYQKIPFQYSLHIQKDLETEPEHREFLAEAGTDPRRHLAERLCADIPKDAFVFAYSMSFEKKCFEDLAVLFPDLSDHLMNIRSNIRDLIVPFQKRAWHSHVHQGFCSLKDILPAMFPNNPELDYNGLNQIHNGGDASAAYMMLPSQNPQEQKRTRAALLAYCHLDTYAMAKIFQKLHYLSASEEK